MDASRGALYISAGLPTVEEIAAREGITRRAATYALASALQKIKADGQMRRFTALVYQRHATKRKATLHA
jgi:hypothetical protein